MNDTFFDYRHQLLRELQLRWRLRQRGNALLGAFLVLASFYLFHWPGYSQVYDVILPYFAAAVYIAVTVLNESYAERIHPTSTFFRGLPRARGVALDATLLYFLGHALFYQVVIAIGVFLKLGGADITPAYRIHPDIMVLPFAAIVVTLWLYHGHSYWDTAIGITAVGIGTAIWVIIRLYLLGTGTPANNFLPPRFLSLGLSTAVALLIILGGTLVMLRERDPKWMGEES